MGMNNRLWSELKKTSNDQVKVTVKNKEAKCIACDFSVKRLVHLVWFYIATNDP